MRGALCRFGRGERVPEVRRYVVVVAVVVNGGTSHDLFFYFLRKMRIKESISYIKLTDSLIHKFYITYGLVNPYENLYNSYRLVNPYDLYGFLLFFIIKRNI